MSPYNSDQLIDQTYGLTPDGWLNWTNLSRDRGYARIDVGLKTGDQPTFDAAQKVGKAVQAKGQPAHIVFRRGYTEAQYDAMMGANIDLSGVSPELPLMITADENFTAARMRTSKGFGIGGNEIQPAGQPVNDVFVSGIDFYDPAADPSSKSYVGAGHTSSTFAFRCVGPPSRNFVIEDCSGSYISAFLDFEMGNPPAIPWQTLIIRRSQIFATLGQKYGTYTQRIIDLLIDESLYDECGWTTPANKNDQTHLIYDQKLDPTETGVDSQNRLRNLILGRSSSHGFQLRPGGTAQKILCVGTPIGGFVGTFGQANLLEDMVLDAGAGEFDLTCGPNQPRGQGFSLNACAAGTMRRLICCNKPAGVASIAACNGWAFAIQCNDTSATPNVNVPVQAELEDLIAYNWNGPSFAISYAGSVPFTSYKVSLSGFNDLPGSKYASGPTPQYVDPSRTVARWAQRLGGTSAAWWLNTARLMRRGNWDRHFAAAGVLDYIQEGFQVMP